MLLTVSGSEITDAVRSAGTSGDGRAAPDSSFGIWPAITNYVTNGGFESNVTGYNAVGATTIARQTGVTKFGSASALVAQGGTTSDFTYINCAIAPAQNSTWTASFWVKAHAAGDVGKTVYLRVDTGGGTYEAFNSAAVALTTSWQRITLSCTWANTGHTSMNVILRADAGACSVDLDGVQLEQSAVATPYIETNGATASRGAGRVQVPSWLIDPRQGWVALCMRMGYAAASLPQTLVFFDHGGASNNVFGLYADTNNALRFQSVGPAGSVFLSTPASFALAGTVILLGYWANGACGVSVNGATPAAGTHYYDPGSPPGQYVGIGSGGGQFIGYPGCEDLFWAAMGRGALTTTDITNIGALTATDPDFRQFSDNVKPMFLWSANTANAFVLPVRSVF